MTAHTVVNNGAFGAATLCVDVIALAWKILPGQAPVTNRAVIFIDDKLALKDQHIGYRDMAVQRHFIIRRKAKNRIGNLALRIHIQNANIKSGHTGKGLEINAGKIAQKGYSAASRLSMASL